MNVCGRSQNVVKIRSFNSDCREASKDGKHRNMELSCLCRQLEPKILKLPAKIDNLVRALAFKVHVDPQLYSL